MLVEVLRMDTTGTSVLLIVVIVVAALLIILARSRSDRPQWAQLVVTGGPGQREPRPQAGLRFLDPRRRPWRPGRPSRAVHRGSAPDRHYQGQRAAGRRLPDLLEDRGPDDSQIKRRKLRRALQGVAATSLRSHRRHSARRLLSQREKINETLRLKLDEVTERWAASDDRRDPRDPGRHRPCRRR